MDSFTVQELIGKNGGYEAAITLAAVPISIGLLFKLVLFLIALSRYYVFCQYAQF